MFLDSFYMVKISENAQSYANTLMIIMFIITFFRVNKRLKEQMLAAVLIAYFGEYLFSILMGMYTYRLENVPHYIPFGHAFVYIAVLCFSKAASIKIHHKFLERFLTVFIFIYATIFLIFKNDVFVKEVDRFDFKGIHEYVLFNPFEAQIDTGRMMHALLQKAILNNIFNLFYHLLNIAFIMSVVVVVHSLMNYIL